jgi:hypothetical protein
MILWPRATILYLVSIPLMMTYFIYVVFTYVRKMTKIKLRLVFCFIIKVGIVLNYVERETSIAAQDWLVKF